AHEDGHFICVLPGQRQHVRDDRRVYALLGLGNVRFVAVRAGPRRCPAVPAVDAPWLWSALARGHSPAWKPVQGSGEPVLKRAIRHWIDRSVEQGFFEGPSESSVPGRLAAPSEDGPQAARSGGGGQRAGRRALI